MTQPANFGVPRSGPATPTVMAERIDDSFDALLSQHKGATAPTYAVAGTRWWDDSVVGTITIKEYDGVDWVVVGTIDTDENTFVPGASASSIRAILGLTDSELVSRITNTVGPLAGLRNLLINALGTINQRGYTSGTATSGANQYTVDRWRVVTSGQSLSWTESEGVRTFTAPAGGVEQVIEGANILSGAHVLNWEGTATATVNGTTRTKGESFTLTGGANATVRFSGGTFSTPQLEPGSGVSPFERRPRSTEERLCMRYYEVAGGPGASGTAAACPFANGFASSTWFFKERKRATPTISFGSGSEGDGDNTTVDYSRIFSSSTNATITAGSTANAEL